MTQNEVEIVGIITPSDWDNNGNISNFVLATYDEKQYRLDHYQKQKLLVMLRQKVKVSGIVEENSKGDKSFIKIKNLQLI